MARTIIDEIGVVTEVDTAPFFRGLEIADNALEQFRAHSKATITLDARLDVASLEASLDALLPGTKPTLDIPVRLVGADLVKREVEQISAGISPQAFEAFSQATTQSFGQIAQALASLNTTLAQITGGIEGFFQGAVEGLRGLEIGATKTTAAVDRIVAGMSRAGDGTLAFEAGLRRIAEAQEQSRQAAEFLASANTRLLEGLSQAGRQALEAAAGTRAWEEGLRSLAATQAQETQAAAAALEREAEALREIVEARRQATLAAAQERLQLATSAGAGPATAALALPTGFDKLAVDQARAATGSRDLAQGFALASRQAKILADATAAAATGNGRIAAGFALAAEQVRAAAAAEASLAVSTGQAAQAFNFSSVGGSRLLNTLSGIAVGAAGAGGRIGTLASNLLTFTATAAAGGVAGALVVGTAAAIGLAYEALTGKTREAREELEKFIDAQVRAGKLRADPASELRDKLREANAELGRTEAKIADLTSTRNQLLNALSGGLDPQAIIQVNGALGGTARQLEEARNRAADLRDTIRETQTQIGETVSLTAGQELISQLGQQAAALQTSERAVQRLAIAANTKLTPAEREAALALFDQITATERANEALKERLDLLSRMVPAPESELAGGPVIELKPRIDNTELLAAVGRFVAAAKQARLDDAFQKGIDRATASAKALQDALQGVDLELKDIGNSNKIGPAALAQKLLDVGRGINDIAHAFDFATQQLHIFGEDGSRILQNLGNLAQDATSAIAGILTGNPFQAAAGFFNAIGDLGGIFGGQESEHDRVVRENTEALKQNTASQRDAFRGAGGQLDLAQRADTAIEQFRAASDARQARIEDQVRSGVDRTVAEQQAGLAPNITPFLQAQGLSLEDLQRVADEVAPGLQLIDKNGHLVVDALAQLDKAIEQSVKAQFRFSRSFDDQLTRTNLESRLGLGREQTPQEKFNQEVLAATGSGADVIRDAFKGIDLGDPDAVRKSLAGLEQAFANGTLDLNKLGSLSRDDFLRFLEDGADFLDTLGQSADKAAKQLSDLNIPDGFRRQALAFQNADLGPPGLELTAREAPVPQTPIGGDGAALPAFSEVSASLKPVGEALPRLTDVLDAQDDTLGKLVQLLEAGADAAGGSAAGVQPLKQVVVQLGAGAIVVHAAPGQTGAITADQILDRLRGLAMAQSGDTLQTSGFN